MIREIITRYNYDKVKNLRKVSTPGNILHYCMAHLKNKKLEYFEVLFLNDKFRLIASEILSQGNVDCATIYMRRLAELILKYHAVNIICVHNHPSGDPTPSDEDKRITKILEYSLGKLSVNLIDHIIVGDGKIYSFTADSYILL